MAKRRRRRLITRRRLKWAGLVPSIAVIVVLALSFWFDFGWVRQNPPRRDQAGFASARFYWTTRLMEGPLSDIEIRTNQQSKGYMIRRNGLRFNHQMILPLFDSRMNSWPKRFSFTIPRWMPFLLIVVPTLYCWRTDQRIEPWQCRGCRYDLRGLEGGGAVCPECGLAKGEG